MIDLTRYKAIIFDWDGTLVDSTDWVLAAHNHVRKNMDKPLWSKDDIFGCSSLSTRELYPEIYGENAQAAMSLLHDYTSKYNLEGSNPYHGAKELLEFLVEQNQFLGVVSNKRHEPLNELIDHMKWRSYFVSTIGAGYAKRDKPHSSPLMTCIIQIDSNLTAKDILYVGDTETDLMTAKNTECDVVFIQSDKPRPDLIKKYSPNYSFNNLKEFTAAVTMSNVSSNRQAI